MIGMQDEQFVQGRDEFRFDLIGEVSPTFCERLSNSSVTPFFDFYKI
jgi:hypothetical protein